MTTNEIVKYLKNPGLLNEETLLATEALINKYPAFETGWFLWIRNLKNTGCDNFEEKISEAAIRVSNRKDLKKYLADYVDSPHDTALPTDFILASGYLPETESVEANGHVEENGSKMNLINNFLSGRKDIKPPADVHTISDPESIVSLSLAENDDLITETYANILLSQGNLEKALQAFEKLSLKYPEKNIYFAARIEEVRNKMNY